MAVGAIQFGGTSAGAGGGGGAGSDTTAVHFDAAQSLTSGQSQQARVNIAAAHRLTPTATKTSAYTAALGDLVPVDATSAAVTVTAPASGVAGSRFAVKRLDSSANLVTIAGAGADVFVTGVGTTAASVTFDHPETREFIYDGTSKWFVSNGNNPNPALHTTGASGATLTLVDPTSQNDDCYDVTLTANCTITLPTLGSCRSFTLRLTQDATGSRLVTWPGTVKWSQAIAPVLSTVGGKQDILTFISISGTAWQGFLAGLDMR